MAKSIFHTAIIKTNIGQFSNFTSSVVWYNMSKIVHYQWPSQGTDWLEVATTSKADCSGLRPREYPHKYPRSLDVMNHQRPKLYVLISSLIDLSILSMLYTHVKETHALVTKFFFRMSVKCHGGGTICESDGAHGLQILEVHAEAGGGGLPWRRETKQENHVFVYNEMIHNEVSYSYMFNNVCNVLSLRKYIHIIFHVKNAHI